MIWANATSQTVSSHARDLEALPHGHEPSATATLAELSDPPIRTTADGSVPAASLVRRLRAIADKSRQFYQEMDFTFLFDPTRKLFSIGFRVHDGALDPSYYDLLASEARLASFLAIAKGDVGPDHWFRLGRALTPVGRGSALISWSGSMFEYLMPALVMRAPAHSLLEQTNRLVVARQIRYAADRGVPWGISESGYNARDLAQTYQYSSFGVPGLGLKRGLSEDLVVAPYATALAAMVRPEAAVRNFARLSNAGAAGRYGFREALDFTARRLPEDETVAIVSSYMAHHQGMALVSLGNVLNDNVMVDRFHADPTVEATELLLQERMPRDVLVARPRAEEVKSAADVRDLVPPMLRRFTSPHDAIPRTHLLSNGRYAVMVTAAGSGYSRWRDVAVTRWREDVTRDSWGSYLYVRDMHTGVVRSRGSPAELCRCRQLRGHLLGGPRRVLPTRRLDRHHIDHRGFHRARRRDPPRVADQPQFSRTRDRADVVRRARPGHAGGRRSSPGLSEPVRADRIRPGSRRAPGDSPAEIQRRDADLGRTRCRRGGRDRCHRPVRNGSRPIPRPWPFASRPGLDHRRTALVEHGRQGARPDLQPALPGQTRPRRDGPRHLLHRRRRIARGGVGPGRQVPRTGHVRTSSDPGLDAGTGPAPSPGHQVRRGPPLPTPGQPDPLFGSVAATGHGPAGKQRPGGIRAVGPRDLRRPAHRLGADRRSRGPRHRSTTAPRPRVLADEAARCRPRDHQRARPDVRPEPPRFAGGAGAHEQVHVRPRRRPSTTARCTSCAANG